MQSKASQDSTHTSQGVAGQRQGAGGVSAGSSGLLQAMADHSPQVRHLQSIQRMADTAVKQTGEGVVQRTRLAITYTHSGSQQGGLSSELSDLAARGIEWYSSFPAEAYQAILNELASMKRTLPAREYSFAQAICDRVVSAAGTRSIILSDIPSFAIPGLPAAATGISTGLTGMDTSPDLTPAATTDTASAAATEDDEEEDNTAELIETLNHVEIKIPLREGRDGIIKQDLNIGKYMADYFSPRRKLTHFTQKNVYTELRAFHTAEAAKPDADLDLVTALHWACEILYIAPKETRGKAGGGNVVVNYHAGGIGHPASVAVVGRPDFEQNAMNLPGMRSGYHRRHIIAWHTIKGAVVNMTNQILALQNGSEGITGLNKIFETLITKIYAEEAKTKTADDVDEEEDDAATAAVAGPKTDDVKLQDNLVILLRKLNSNIKNLWPGEGYQNSLINTYQGAFRKWAVDVVRFVDPRDAEKWRADKCKALLPKIGKPPKGSYGKTLQAFYDMLENWETPKTEKEVTVGMLLANFLNRCADTFEVDFPYSPDRVEFDKRHKVASSLVSIAGTMLTWAEEGDAKKFAGQNLTDLVLGFDAVINQFMFPSIEAPPAEETAIAPKPGKTGISTAKTALASVPAKTASSALHLPLHPEAVPLPRLRGLDNIGNSCYIASVMHLVKQVREYMNLFAAFNYAGARADISELARTGTVVLNNIDTPGGPTADQVRAFRSSLITTGWLARGEESGQQDAGLLLNHLIATLTPDPPAHVQGIARERALKQGRAVKAHTYKDRNEAAYTPEHRAADEYSPTLLLDGIKGGHEGGERTMESLLRENLDGRVKSEMNAGVVRDHRWRLTGELPRVLTIQLKRFNFSTILAQSFKLHEKISTGAVFTIPADLAPDGAAHDYHLKGFIMHLGATPGGGHYVSYVRVGARWYFYDDADQHAVPVADALERVKDAYIVTYEAG